MSERKPQWTPGEWKVYRRMLQANPQCPSVEELRIGTVYDHPQLKGPIPVVTTAHGVGGTYVFIREPDAHLLAAAPDLYAELQHLVMALEPVERAAGMGIPGIATLNGPRRALAKARGEEAPE